MALLETKGLSKVYRLGDFEVLALDAVDLAVERGELLAIMGPSGSGKSTLLHLLGGLDRPTRGSIRLDGMDLATLDDDTLTLVRRRQIGFVFQFFHLLPTLSAEENVALPLLIDGQPLDQHRQRIAELLRLVGLYERHQHRPDQLSGGEQQRVAIARALVTSPAILLADEPTGNLDTATGNQILGLLQRSRDELGQTLILVTHDPQVASFAERIIYLRDGRIEREERH